MYRAWAIVERELRRFRRSPLLIIVSMIFPIVQLVVLGYAFGGNVKHLKLAIVDQDHGVPAVKVREPASAAAAGSHCRHTDYADQGEACDLRNGRVNGVLTIAEFSRRVLQKNQPRVALIEMRRHVRGSRGDHHSMLGSYNNPGRAGVPAGDARRSRGVSPRAMCAGCCRTICMSIFMMVMIGGGIIFIDDRRAPARGYLVTPITKFELIAGFNVWGD
jgi:ABC-2 type transport system permease protein